MMVFRPGDAITLSAGEQGARIMALGGETLNGPRHIWWNFVSSRRERIARLSQANVVDAERAAAQRAALEVERRVVDL